MKFRKLISVCLAIVLSVSVLTACGNTDKKEEESKAEASQTTEVSKAESAATELSTNSEDEKKEIVFPLEETMEFSALALVVNENYPLEENVVWKYLQEKANIEVELTTVVAAESKEKGNLILSGGVYPDFLFKLSQLDMDSYGMDGILIPLEDLIKEYMPNLTALLDERNAWSGITASDGHIYSLPNVSNNLPYGWDNNRLWINEVWMERLGLTMPQNMEELYDVLTAFKEQDANGNGDVNDEMPLSLRSKQYLYFLPYIGDAKHFGQNFTALKDEEMVFYPYTDGFKEYLSWLAKFYAEGLLDPDTFTQSKEQCVAKAQAGDVTGMFSINNPHNMVAEANVHDYISFIPFVPENFCISDGVNKNAFAITDKCENPEVLLSWIDYLYSEEGGILAQLGIEGDTYEVNADGTYVVTGEQYENGSQYALTGSGSVPYWQHPWIQTGRDCGDDIAQARVYEGYAEGGVFKMGTILPTLRFAEEESERLSVLSTDISGYVCNYCAEVISGKLVLEDSWEDFHKNLKLMGADEYLSIYQAAYERYAAN